MYFILKAFIIQYILNKFHSFILSKHPPAIMELKLNMRYHNTNRCRVGRISRAVTAVDACDNVQTLQ
jgi:hypothetical protein